MPALVFSATPSTPKRLRSWRLRIAFLTCYVLTLVRVIGWYMLFSYGYITYNTYEAHSGLNIKPTLHWIVLGWAWSCAYIGFWEFLWRERYQEHMVSLRLGLGDDKVSIIITNICRYVAYTIVAFSLFAILMRLIS